MIIKRVYESYSNMVANRIGSLSWFDIYYNRIYLKPPTKKLDSIKYKRSPKKWAKNCVNV